ncbi:MAG TPA: VOC family protein [Acidimicrobiia bacterium]|jgi:catechol 2,3-dioxygenase-like lactoylglutathione lyase family enzyme
MDMKLEVVILPVSDVDRAKDFYVNKVGFHLDVDHQPSEDFRVVQMTPPGSACSATIGMGLTDNDPGVVKGTHLIVGDIEAARAELSQRGVVLDEVRYMGPEGWVLGVDPERRDYATFSGFSDPDGNSWILQEVGHGTAH